MKIHINVENVKVRINIMTLKMILVRTVNQTNSSTILKLQALVKIAHLKTNFMMYMKINANNVIQSLITLMKRKDTEWYLYKNIIYLY